MISALQGFSVAGTGQMSNFLEDLKAICGDSDECDHSIPAQAYPSDIMADRALSDLGFQDADFIRLTGRFNVIVKAVKPAATELDIDDVKACIDGVTDAVK